MSTHHHIIQTQPNVAIEVTSTNTGVTVAVSDANGTASITLDPDDVRKLMVNLGSLVEPYAGAWRPV